MTEPSAEPSIEAARYLSDAESTRLKRLYPDLWLSPERGCPTCLDLRAYTDIGGVQHECDCTSQWLLHRFLLHCGVLMKYQRLTWADLDDQIVKNVEVMNAVLGYCDNAKANVNSGIGLVLRGSPGTGKTMLAVLLLKKLLGLGYDGYFTQFNTMLASYTAGWKDKDDQQWFERRVHHAGVLVIDDIGKESKGRENVTNSLFDQVIRTRVASDKPTIITTNYTEEQLQSGYGGPVMSLLAESCFVHEVPGRDFRPRAKNRMLAESKFGYSRPVVLP